MSATHELDAHTPTAEDAGRDTRRAWWVFVVAFVIRLAVAAAFLGGFDSLNSIRSMPVALNHDYIDIPYFPLIANWLGLSGLVDAHWVTAAKSLGVHVTTVPFGVFSKLLPCLADSLLAAWFTLDTRLSPRRRSLASWAYAACPLAFIIVCFQGQWDPVWILFALTALAVANMGEPSTRTRLVAGVLFALAVLLKPTPIFLLPLLFGRWRERRDSATWVRHAWPVVVGALTTMALAFAWFALEGIELSKNLHDVLDYSTTNNTVVAVGLARTSELNHFGDPTGFLRDLSIVLTLALVVGYHFTRRRIDPMAVAAAVFLVLPAIGGYNGQYLLWAVPFLLAAGRFRPFAIVSALSTFVVAAYCVFPRLWFGGGEETTFFFPVRHLQFLAIPDGAKGWLTSGTPPDIWRPISNLVLPVVMVVIAVMVLRPRPNDRGRASIGDRELLPRALTVNVPLVLTFVVAGVAYALGPFPGDARTVASHFTAQLRGYGIGALPRGLSLPSGTWWGSVLVLIPVLTMVWAVAVWVRGGPALGTPAPAASEPASAAAGVAVSS